MPVKVTMPQTKATNERQNVRTETPTDRIEAHQLGRNDDSSASRKATKAVAVARGINTNVLVRFAAALAVESEIRFFFLREYTQLMGSAGA